MDTECRYSVAGERWYRDYLELCKQSGLQAYCEEQPEHEVYRFGNATKCSSSIRATVPCYIAGPRMISFSVIPVPSLGLLLGDDFFEEIGGTLDLSKNQFRPRGCSSIELGRSTRGHRSIDLRPQDFTPPLRTSAMSPTRGGGEVHATSKTTALLQRLRVPLAVTDEGRQRRAKAQRPTQEPSRRTKGFKRGGLMTRIMTLCGLALAAPFALPGTGSSTSPTGELARGKPALTSLPGGFLSRAPAMPAGSTLGDPVRAPGAGVVRTPLSPPLGALGEHKCGDPALAIGPKLGWPEALAVGPNDTVHPCPLCDSEQAEACLVCGKPRCAECTISGACAGCSGILGPPNAHVRSPEAVRSLGERPRRARRCSFRLDADSWRPSTDIRYAQGQSESFSMLMPRSRRCAKYTSLLVRRPQGRL